MSAWVQQRGLGCGALQLYTQADHKSKGNTEDDGSKNIVDDVAYS